MAPLVYHTGPCHRRRLHRHYSVEHCVISFRIVGQRPVNREQLDQRKRSTLFQVDDRVEWARKGDDDDRRRSDIEGRSVDEPSGMENLQKRTP